MTDDALLAALADARCRKDQAARDMRLLLAYAREIVSPRPYRLTGLAQAAGLSISGVRTAYTPSDACQARQLLTAAPGCGDQRHTKAAIAALLTLPVRQPPVAAITVS